MFHVDSLNVNILMHLLYYFLLYIKIIYIKFLSELFIHMCINIYIYEYTHLYYI